MSRRTLAVVLVAVAAGVTLAARLGRTPPTDEELIRALFEDAARAAEEKKVSDAVAGVSERFSSSGLDRRGVKQLVAFHVLRGDWVSVSVAGVKLRVEGVSERFRGGGLDRRGVKQLVAFHVMRGEWVSVSVAGARISVAGEAARANVDAVLARGSGKGKALEALVPGEATAHRFACRLEREPEGWRIVEADWRAIGLADALAGPPAAAEAR